MAMTYRFHYSKNMFITVKLYYNSIGASPVNTINKKVVF